ncbi:MAG: metallophosphoesterase family protein [Candidatus Marinimicrobia bacterium]|nr:metallophosphoesterase family protein [Candidatus Neomarinimicrobiota bacterium]MBL7047000.1 metallophosphoesterase family protein [Candidatus Neomarinimicrobiota bacterium]
MADKTFAILSDIHSNLSAFKTALSIIEEHKDVDQLICLGDCFALGPAPVEVLEILLSLNNCIFIRGNHDRYLIEKIWEQENPSLEGMNPYDPICIGIVQNERWTYEQIGQEGIDFIRQMHISHREIIDNTQVEFTHAWYGRDDEPPSIEEATNWRNHVALLNPNVDQFVFVHGHIHIPRFEQDGNLKILCQGATGLPFDKNPKGAVGFLTVGNEFNWDVRRFSYDRQATLDLLDERKPSFYRNLQSTVKYAEIRNEF